MSRRTAESMARHPLQQRPAQPRDRAYVVVDDTKGKYHGTVYRTGGVIQPVWIDDRTGFPQAYTARIIVSR